MSDDWAQCPICGSDVGAGAVADYDRAAYETGVQDSMLRATQYERILTDLIADVRDQVRHYPPDVFRDFTDDDPASQSRTPDRIAGVAMRHAWTRAGDMADRAEARLRVVQHPRHDEAALHDTHPHTPLLTPLFGQWRLLGWLGHIDLRRVRLGIRR